MRKKLLIMGAGGFGREVASWALDAAERGAAWVPVGYLDDGPAVVGEGFAGLPWLGDVGGYQPSEDTQVVVAVGSPGIRRRIQEQVLRKGGTLASVIHPTALVARGARLGAGVVLAPYAVVSANASVGGGVVVNVHAVVQHDARVGGWCQLNTHSDVGGGAVLGEEVLVKTGGIVRPRAVVPDRCVIEAGTLFPREDGPGRMPGGPGSGQAQEATR